MSKDMMSRTTQASGPAPRIKTVRRDPEREHEQPEQLRNEMLTVLSHELRNPLVPLTTGLALLQRQPGQSALVERIHNMMERQLTHLQRLVDDLLDLSRVTRGAVVLYSEPLELQSIIDTAAELIRPQVEARTHQLIVEPVSAPLWVNGDQERLIQVIVNVLSNAVKYTAPGGRIWVRVEANADSALIRVRDCGYGIPEDQLEEIFGMFTQVPQHRSESGGGGLGVGLALCRQLLELHGGTITASSEGLGFGSEFQITLPRAASPGQA